MSNSLAETIEIQDVYVKLTYGLAVLQWACGVSHDRYTIATKGKTEFDKVRLGSAASGGNRD